MRLALSSVFGLLVVTTASPGAVAASNEISATKTTVSTMSSSQLSATDADRASLWGLSSDEWKRYESIMKGPRGLWSPNLDPIWVLGSHARTDNERRRYAQMAAKQEKARVEGELAFMRTYTDVSQEIFGNEGLVDANYFLNHMEKIKAKKRTDEMLPSRVMFFTSLDEKCEECERRVYHLLRLVNENKTSADIYFEGSNPEKDALKIQDWARRHSISVDLVNQRRVTLNHGGVILARLGKTNKTLPKLMVRQGTTVEDIPLEKLQ